MGFVSLMIYCGPCYMREESRYVVDSIMCASNGVLMPAVPRGSNLEKLAAIRPSRARLISKKSRRISLYPSEDALGREHCTGLTATLTKNELEFLNERESQIIRIDATGELLGAFGIHEVLEALKQDEKSRALSSKKQTEAIANVKSALQSGLDQRRKRGTPYMVCLY